MTGEITLRGDVLPIGGLKEKVLAAQAAGIHTVMLPKLNRRDLVEIPATVHKGLTLIAVESMDDVLDRVLLPLRPAVGAPTAPERRAAVRSGARALRIARLPGARPR